MAFYPVVRGDGPFAPAAGEEGTTALHMDSSAFVSWATEIAVVRGYINIADTTVYIDGNNRATFGEPQNVLGKATGNSNDVISLGDGGMATLQFDRPIINGPGPDFAVFENGFGDNFLELAFVAISTDGENFVRFPSYSYTQTETQVESFGILDPAFIHNFAGKYRAGYGTPFDLDDLIDSTGIDFNDIRYVRIIDAVGCIDCGFETHDTEGNIINDPWPTPFHTGGFDLEAAGIINAGEPFNPTTVGYHNSHTPKVYPNPFDQTLFIEATEGSDVVIYDLTGRKIKHESLTGNSLQINDLQRGYYIVQIIYKNKTEIFKVLKI
ncbi:MAG: T9SS type A sorting domain-containing protein [Bacteroidales bacterium]